MSIRQLFSFFVLLLLPAVAVSNGDRKISDVNGNVRYFGFEIERIAGIPENQIDQYGCNYTIQQSDFVSLLRSDDDLEKKYDKLDIRARVSFSDDCQYFINPEGIVRQGKKYYVINKDDFVRLLTPTKKEFCQ